MNEDELKLPQMITISEAAKESNMTYCSIRQLCIEGKVQYIRVGSSTTNAKYLINKKSFCDYLNGNVSASQKRTANGGNH